MTTLSDSQIAGYAAAAGFTSDQVPIMVAIALAESSGVAEAIHTNNNGSTDRGLWQINSIHSFSGNLFDPAVNAAAARTVYNQQGYQAWSTYNSGAYTRYLGRGKTADSKAANTSANSSGGGNTSGGDPALAATVSAATSGNTWLRIGEFVAGSALLIFAVLRLTGGDKILISTAKTAGMAAAL